MKTKLFVAIFISMSLNVFAQEKSIGDRYNEVKHFRNTEGTKPKHIAMMINLLNDSSNLTLNQITTLQFHIGRSYEEISIPDSAIIYYEKSLKGEPDYEVIHRALGFIYLAKTKPFVEQMNVATKNKDALANSKAYNGYKSLVQIALPYLEKYQACSPDDETLMIITNLYKSIKDIERLKTIDARLKLLNKRCVTLLEDE